MSLPALPAAEQPWSPSVYTAFDRLDIVYRTASAYIDGASMESHRLEVYSNSLISDAFPILLLLEKTADQEGIPMKWLRSVADLFSELYVQVQEHLITTNPGLDVDGVRLQTPVKLKYTGKPGRPKKEIDPDVLREALGKGRRISVNALAKALGVHKNTLHAKIKELGIDTGYDKITDDKLDEMVRKYRLENPDGGRGYTIGHIRAMYSGRIQGPRILASMARVDKLGQGLRAQVGEKKKHETYSVPRPHSLWHIDGHHKLILWGIVIHGVADGYSRTITGLRASGNNTAQTVLRMFLEAVEKHGVPSRVRGDRGGENRDVSILMILLRGLKRASFMWGSSVFNTRIERMWVEVGRRFARAWRAFFTRLEHLHLLNRRSKHHRWLLHYLFLDQINTDCDTFCTEWNAHPISGVGKNMSPNDMVFLGQLQHGIYEDPTAEMNDKQANQFFGFDEDGEPLDGQEIDDNDDVSGAEDGDVDGADFRDEVSDMGDEPELGDTSDELDLSEDESSRDAFDILEASENTTDSNIRHKAVPVPSCTCPFDGPHLQLFEQALGILKASGDLPPGYGIDPSEWPPSGYPSTQTISIGLRMKSFPISLPDSIWRPRAEIWAQALYVVDEILRSRGSKCSTAST